MVDFLREKTISMRKAAELLDVSRKTVYAWAKADREHRLETALVGGLRKTSVEAIQRFSIQNDSPTTSAQSQPSDYEAAKRNLQAAHGF